MDEEAEHDRLDSLRSELESLERAIAEEEARQGARKAEALPRHRLSAVNLAHYLGLRKQDIRLLQLELAALGLSSLGRSEGHVRDTLLRIRAWLAPGRGRERMRNRATPSTGPRPSACCTRTLSRSSARVRASATSTSW